MPILGVSRVDPNFGRGWKAEAGKVAGLSDSEQKHRLRHGGVVPADDEMIVELVSTVHVDGSGLVV